MPLVVPPKGCWPKSMLRRPLCRQLCAESRDTVHLFDAFRLLPSLKRHDVRKSAARPARSAFCGGFSVLEAKRCSPTLQCHQTHHTSHITQSDTNSRRLEKWGNTCRVPVISHRNTRQHAKMPPDHQAAAIGLGDSQVRKSEGCVAVKRRGCVPQK